jgi:hypothetical protein
VLCNVINNKLMTILYSLTFVYANITLCHYIT